MHAAPGVATQSQKPAEKAPQLPEQHALPFEHRSPGWPQLPASGMGAQSPPWQTPRQQSPDTLHACPSVEQLQPTEMSQIPEQHCLGRLVSQLWPRPRQPPLVDPPEELPPELELDPAIEEEDGLEEAVDVDVEVEVAVEVEVEVEVEVAVAAEVEVEVAVAAEVAVEVELLLAGGQLARQT